MARSNWVMAFAKFIIRNQAQTSSCDLENTNRMVTSLRILFLKTARLIKLMAKIVSLYVDFFMSFIGDAPHEGT